MFRCAFERWSDAETTSIFDGKKRAPAKVKKDTLTHKERTLRLWLAKGFILRTKTAGWKLFCDRMGASPFHLWKGLPGFDRLLRELDIVEGTPDRPSPAFTPTGMVRWLNTIRPPGKPPATEGDIMTAARCADSLDVAFREHVEWWGGPRRIG